MQGQHLKRALSLPLGCIFVKEFLSMAFPEARMIVAFFIGFGLMEIVR